MSPIFYNKNYVLCNQEKKQIALGGQIKTRPYFFREDFWKGYSLTSSPNVILEV